MELPGDLSICGVGTDGNDTIEYTEFLAAALDKSKVLKEERRLFLFGGVPQNHSRTMRCMTMHDHASTAVVETDLTCASVGSG